MGLNMVQPRDARRNVRGTDGGQGGARHRGSAVGL